MSSTRNTRRAPSAGAELVAIARTGRGVTERGVVVVPAPADIRAKLAAFYRERDEADALAYTMGMQKVRGDIWALGLKRLEDGDPVYESYGVLASAGIELSAEADAILGKLPDDLRRICHIDSDGVVTVASVKGRMRSGR